MKVDTNYNKFNINKLSRNGQTDAGEGATVYIGTSSANYESEQNQGGIEGHYLWGQYFDATQDVSGDIDVDGDIKYSGNINFNGDQGSDLVGNVNGNQGIFQKVAASNRIDTNNLGVTNEAIINKLTGNQGIITQLTSNTANITALTSDNIHTHDLTVTGSAHFFELVIDQIKSIGGAIMLTPADGFTIYGISVYTSRNAIRLWFVAEEEYNSTTRAIQNKWQIGDQALIQSFNKSVTGTSTDVSNTYWWSVVTSVSTTPEEHNGVLCHYIECSMTECDGSYYGIQTGLDVVMCGHRKQSYETEAEAAERQTAIYISAYSGSSGAYDPVLLAPFYIQYTGVNNFNLSNHRHSWFSSGTRNNTIPQNRFQGVFVLSSGDTIEEYVDESIHNAGFDMFNIDVAKVNWFVQTNENYVIDASLQAQSFNTDFELMNNGGQWNASSVEIYKVFGTTETLAGSVNKVTTGTFPYTTSISSIGATFTQYDASGHKWNIKLDGPTCFSTWYGYDNYVYRIKMVFDDRNGNSQSRYFDINLIKQAKGEDGSATAVAMEEFFLVPTNELATVDATGAMVFNAAYSLKRIYTDSQGNTITNLNYTIPNDFSVIYDDNAGVMQGAYATKSGNNFVINVSPYVSDYITRQNKPTIIRVYLVKGSSTNIDKRVVPVQFNTSAVFTVKQDAITAAVTGSQSYTDNSLISLNNRMSSVEQTANGVQVQVAGFQTTIDEQQGIITQQQQDITNLQIGAQGLTSRVSSLEDTGVSQSQITSIIEQTSRNVSLGVQSNIEGELQTAGINITTGEVGIQASKFSVYDNGNKVIGTQDGVFRANNVIFDDCSVVNKLKLNDADDSDHVGDTYIWADRTDGGNIRFAVDGVSDMIYMATGNVRPIPGGYTGVQSSGLYLGNYSQPLSGYKAGYFENDAIRMWYNYNGNKLSTIKTGYGLGDGGPWVESSNGMVPYIELTDAYHNTRMVITSRGIWREENGNTYKLSWSRV